MKKYFLYIVLQMICSLAIAQNITFTDINFKNCLLAANEQNLIARDSNWAAIVVDTNNDQQIQLSEALNVVTLDLSISYCSNLIADLGGLENFTNLTGFGLENSQVTTLNLMPLTQLNSVFLRNNNISSLNLASLHDLIGLSIKNCPIANLNFSGLLNLKYIILQEVLVTNLDFSNNPLFDWLEIESLPNLTTLKIKNNRPQLFNLNGNNARCPILCPNLNYICADNSEIPNLQNFLSSCGITQPITINSACALDTENFETYKLKVYPNPSNYIFNIDIPKNQEQYKNVEVIDILGQTILNQVLNNQSINQIDLSNVNSGCYFAKINSENKQEIIKLFKN